jgi:hypothetical protein
MGRTNSVVVDLDGLAKLWAERKSRLLFELLSNAHDTKGAKNIFVTIEKVNPDEGDRAYRIRVVDDHPQGFADLSHAYTMFADSEKKNDPEANGMFNLGEKLVIAVSREVTIISTSGGLKFDDAGRHHLRRKTETGSDVEAIVTLTKAEYEEMLKLMGMFIARDEVTVHVNGQVLPHRKPVASFKMTLPMPIAESVAADMKLSKRECDVNIYEPLVGESPMLYGLGVPVVDNNSKWHYHVGQKVPVPFDRDNVPPNYLKLLHVECVNRMYSYIHPENVNDTFVKVAMEDDKIEQGAFHDIRVKKHGEKVVIHDPNFPEATGIAVGEGYIPLYGRSESTGFHKNNRRFNDVKTAQQVTPQAVPYSEDGKPLKLLDEKKITAGMRLVAEYHHLVFKNLVARGGLLSIIWANDSQWPFSATFGRVGLGGVLTFNVGRLGYDWFNNAPADTASIVRLMIHEFAHYYESNHLSADYYRALTDLGARLSVLALKEPKLFRNFRTKQTMNPEPVSA